MKNALAARKFFVALVGTLAFGGTLIVSAEDEKPAKGTAEKSSVETKRTSDSKGGFDQHVAACLVLDNQNEIAQAQLAEKHSKNQEVIAFAQMMEKEHQQFLAELQKISGGQFSDRKLDAKTDTRSDGTKKADPTRNEGATKSGDPQTKFAASPHGSTGDFMLQVKREIADECLASGKKDLEGKQGIEFDASYIGMQLAAHMHMIDELKVLERHVSAEFKPVLQKGRETAEKHLMHAKQVMRSIEHGPRAEKSTKPNAN